MDSSVEVTEKNLTSHTLSVEEETKKVIETTIRLILNNKCRYSTLCFYLFGAHIDKTIGAGIRRTGILIG